MSKPPRALKSPQAAKQECIKLTDDEIAAVNAGEARRRQPRFPLALTASIAERFVVRPASDAADAATFKAAARRAIMLLGACQEELRRDASERAHKEILFRHDAITLKKRRSLERQCRGGVASLKKGLLLITGQPSLTAALPLLVRWRNALDEHQEAFPHLRRDLGSNAQAATLIEIERYRRTGFGIDTLEEFQTGFARGTKNSKAVRPRGRRP